MPAPRFEPTLRSLKRHRLPTWYDDAKFGIFIHWTVASVAGFAPREHDINEQLRRNYDNANVYMPYTEWYENSLRFPESPASEYHRRTYGDRPYASLADDFKNAVEKLWDPVAWAKHFRAAGAQYVVLVTKHHDGFCLWPSGVAHPHRQDWHTQRNCVVELAQAVRAEGMRFGIYYSGGLDWTFEPLPMRTMGDVVAAVPGGDYPAYAEAHVRELIKMVEPDVLWNDIAWPQGSRQLHQLFCDYYAAVPDGVINDRWLPSSVITRAFRRPFVRGLFDRYMRRRFRRPDAALTPAGIGYFDYDTPEYTVFPDVRKPKWECVRGIDKSFGFNRTSQPEDFITREALIHSVVDITAKNGNLLLNVGPRGDDAMIPDLQLERLKWLGEWLGRNGEAIYATRPWAMASGRSADGTELRFTARGRHVYATLLGTPAGPRIILPQLRARPTTRVRLLGGEGLTFEAGDQGIAVTLPALPDSPAHVLAFEDVAAAP